MLQISTGVPQGSVLDTFFFTIKTNGLPCNFNSKPFLYADDTTLLVYNKDEKVLLESIWTAQQKAFHWFSSNKLLLLTLTKPIS